MSLNGDNVDIGNPDRICLPALIVFFCCFDDFSGLFLHLIFFPILPELLIFRLKMKTH